MSSPISSVILTWEGLRSWPLFKQRKAQRQPRQSGSPLATGLPNGRMASPSFFLVFAPLFCGLFCVIFFLYLFSKAAEALCRRLRCEPDDTLEDMFTEDELASCQSQGSVVDLDELEELCASLPSSASTISFDDDEGDGDSCSETIAAMDDEDPFADAECQPLPLVYFIHRKLEGLPYRPESELLPRRPSKLECLIACAGNPCPTRLIHGGSPLRKMYTLEDLMHADQYTQDEDRRTECDHPTLRIPRLRKFISLPSLDTQNAKVPYNRTWASYDHYEWKRNSKRQQLRRFRESVGDSVSA